ncbi:MAG: hypothetical protein GF364_01220 [Candidatus Lokiarchaeota archaeon]|nr:hypothetical protein [Candidatus Lokiarchaeota archaeon]
MVKFLECWIITQDGMTLFHEREKNIQTVDKNLISGFLTAFQSMLKVSKQGDVEAIRFKNTKLLIKTEDEPFKLYFIGRTKDGERDRSIKKELGKLSEKFVLQYWSELESWQGNISVFMNFQTELDGLFKNPIVE